MKRHLLFIEVVEILNCKPDVLNRKSDIENSVKIHVREIGGLSKRLLLPLTR